MRMWSDELCHLGVDRAKSKSENRMIGNYTAELWRPMSCCLWPYWMSHSQGTQPPFRTWINGSWLDFGGLLCCFCLLWHRPSLCEVSLLPSDKGTTSSKGGRAKCGDRNWGRGIIERGVKAASCSLSLHVLCVGVNGSIFMCLWPWFSKLFAVTSC